MPDYLLHATDRGHYDLLAIGLQAGTAPSNFYVALLNDTVLGTDDWADVSANELLVGVNPGYAQAVINRDATADGWPTGPVLDSSEMMITGKEVSFTATANWATAITAVAIVANMATDRLWFYQNRQSLTLAINEVLKVTPKVKLTKA